MASNPASNPAPARAAAPSQPPEPSQAPEPPEPQGLARAPEGVIRYWAAARAAAGVEEEAYRAGTLRDALAAARGRHADRPRFAQVLGVCSFLVDGDPVGTRDHATVRLTDGGTVEVLPPFAGG
jgi:molybdopterin converting factor small subunit